MPAPFGRPHHGDYTLNLHYDRSHQAELSAIRSSGFRFCRRVQRLLSWGEVIAAGTGYRNQATNKHSLANNLWQKPLAPQMGIPD